MFYHNGLTYKIKVFNNCNFFFYTGKINKMQHTIESALFYVLSNQCFFQTLTILNFHLQYNFETLLCYGITDNIFVRLM